MKRVPRIFYIPYWTYLLADVVLLIVSFVVVLAWFPLSTEIPFQKYWVFALVFSALWMAVSYLCHRYMPVKFMKIGRSMARLVVTAVAVFLLMWAYMIWISEGRNYSIWVLLTIWLAMFIASVIFVLTFHAYHYALNAEPEIERRHNRGSQPVLKKPIVYEGKQRQNIENTIVEATSEEVLKWLEQKINIYSSNTYIVRTAELFNIRKIKYYRFDAIVNLMPLNQIRGINKMFGVINDRLADDGLLCCCFQPQEVLKRQILNKYPWGMNWIFYSFVFLYKRVLPKLFMTSRLYYDVTEGKNRVLSKAEVLGRLCYCGFEIVDNYQIDDVIYVVARRSFSPQTVQRRVYGMFVSLNRVGKNGKMIKVYKYRTMHPYSEFLQEYIYEHNKLQEGGKFSHDFRINTLGRFMRKYWIDELPMLLNLMKGNMKLVGVRPISKQYFSLYSKELQDKRIRHKPGLLPPFYADMPKTLEQIEQSEMNYLTRCEQKGTFITDFVYFWKIITTILFKRARSN